LGGGLFEVEQGLMGQLGDDGIGVAKEKDQQPQPREFLGIDSDDRQGAGHAELQVTSRLGRVEFEAAAKFCRGLADMCLEAGYRRHRKRSQMEITGIDRPVPTAHAPAPVAPVDAAAEGREIVQAIKALNGTEMFGPENELRFQKDQQTQRMIVRLVNRKTREVVTQVPAEYVLRLAEDRKRL